MSMAEKRGMKGQLKTFDKSEHIEYDVKGKLSMIEYLDRKFSPYNLRTLENPNQYGIDLLTINSENLVIHCWEVEVRYGNWKGDVPFPYSEINCIERKDYQWRRDKEFIDKIPLQLAEKYRISYVQLNKECSRAVIIESDVILKYPLKPWANRKYDNEFVRQVPISETLQVKLK